MNVVEAIEKLREGCLVRCPTINYKKEKGQEYWLCSKPKSKDIWICAVNIDGHWPQYVYALTVSDVLSTDWEISPEKSKVWD